MNLPTLAIAGGILLPVLKVEAPQKLSLRQWSSSFDFTGLFFVVASTTLLLVGFDSAQTSWSSAETISTIALAGALLVAAAVNMVVLKKRTPLIPPRLFKSRSAGLLIISALLNSIVMFGSQV